VVVSTYQSVTGTGAKAVRQLMDERNGIHNGPKVYPYPIDMNIIPQIDVFLENGYTKEEMKMIKETRKIMSLPDLKITSTTVRIPVTGGHSESVNVSFSRSFELDQIREVLSASPGIQLKDDPATLSYPMPMDSEGNDWVWVGRIRRDESMENALNLWIVSDNLRKGAATNAVQIANYLISKGFL
jgi:aspartate-semialdehyde dehydrogenase